MAFTPTPCAGCGDGDSAAACPPVMSTGLCLADGTPIAVIAASDCEAGTAETQGWLNLTTGAYTAGNPPAGTMACGEGQSVQVSGVFCDVLADEVVGLVLVEYHYDETGAIESVRLVDATTGTTYVPQGEITVCPAGVQQPELDLVQLCDVAADGTPTPFIRDFRRDENGAIVGFANYTLAGATYNPTGTVGLCTEPCSAPFATECAVLIENAWSYDNTAGFDGQASNCGGLQGPVGSAGFPAFTCNAPYRITSWIINGVETITTPLDFDGGPCGDGTGNGMHDHWAALLTQIDPDATWEVAQNATCGYYVRTTDAPEGVEYGAMVVQSRTTPADVWTATPNHRDAQTYFTKLYTRECDGSVTVSWLDAQGEPTTAPVGDVRPCGGPESCSSCQTVQLCDVRRNVNATLPATGTGSQADVWNRLSNGVAWQREGNNVGLPGNWFIATSTGAQPEKFTFDRPVGITYGVKFTNAQTQPLVIPEGWEIASLLVAQHEWDPVTRTISPLPGVLSTGVSTFRSDGSFSSMISPQYTGVQPSGSRSDYGQITITADTVTPFLRTICRDCAGTAAEPVDTTLDGQTEYVPAGEVTSCAVLPPQQPDASPTPGGDGGTTTETDRIVQALCITNAGVTTPFLRHWTVDNATGELTFDGDTELDGATPLGVASGTVGVCGSSTPPAADAVVDTGIARITSGTWTVAANGGAGTQSVTVTVLSGSASITGTIAGPVIVPAGASLTWSVNDTDDSVLNGLGISPGTPGDVLINWTRKATVAG